ncbi:AAA family ATPase [Acetatifactor muris]|uniref:Diadenosine tetraphosphatase n=1 Tax=Acetatifactor muris TaxID=879566 RepID=A0A2K4ZIL2_9FIRM|nr:RNA ligase [Acetatifactor muris]MCR2048437.1 AAA family ATPase [Acetatifactor muris]SOY30242.1 diadenosine tetraphosphatase [Acetatifactor muris]
MRILLLLRGSASCGKSTWIEQHGLKPYTLSADDIRLLCQSPVMLADGSEGISQSNDGTVWKTLFSILEIRMQRGDFTVIDATNSKTSEMNRYREMCETYRYRIYCVDFTDIPIEEVKRRNAGRETFKKVPEEVIDNMYSRFRTQKIPSGIKVIRPDELDTIWLKLFDMSNYRKIHHIGDIHGCNTVLQRYLEDNGGLKDDEMYIFVGDYIDRGVENAEVVKFLISIMNRKNVLMLEGNHERWLWLWANDCTGRSKEFELITKPALDAAGINKKDVRQLYRKFGQCAYYKYGEIIYLVTHAGLSTLPQNLSLVATEQMIKGVGNYDDFEKVAETFFDTTPDNCYQIHGHRNTKQMPTMVNDRVFNLEGQVEYGGCLRCVQVDESGIHCTELENEVYKTPEMQEAQGVVESSIADIIISLRGNKYIQEKKFGNISSFNYTDKAFYDRVWDAQTTKARGLYLDTAKGKVTARAYDKFFNVNERPETKFEMLQHKLKFPVTAYVKENGFLGIVSYNEYEDGLFAASKSTIDSQYARYFQEMLQKKVTPENLERMKEYCKEKEVSFVFECVDMEHDPHIIDYSESRLFLLDIVYNQMEFARYGYDDLCHTAGLFGLEAKERAYEIANWQEFYDWYYDIMESDYEYHGRKIEGFVIEDSGGYMTKIKLSYYNFWKFMRSVSHEAVRKGYISKTSALTTPLANEYYSWVRKLHDREDRDTLPRDICTLRKMFYAEKGI